MRRRSCFLMLFTALCLLPADAVWAADAMTLQEYRQKLSKDFWNDANLPIHEQALKDAGNDLAYKAEAYFNLSLLLMSRIESNYPNTRAEGRAVAEKALKELPRELHAWPYAALVHLAVRERKPDEAKRYMELAAQHATDAAMREELRGVTQDVVHAAAALVPPRLIDAFAYNWPEADKTYTGKEIALYSDVSALVEDSGRDYEVAGLHYKDIRIVGFDYPGGGAGKTEIACVLADSEKERFRSLKKERSAFVAGTVFGKHRDLIILVNCRIIPYPIVLGQRVPLYAVWEFTPNRLTMIQVRQMLERARQ